MSIIFFLYRIPSYTLNICFFTNFCSNTKYVSAVKCVNIVQLKFLIWLLNLSPVHKIRVSNSIPIFRNFFEQNKWLKKPCKVYFWFKYFRLNHNFLKVFWNYVWWYLDMLCQSSKYLHVQMLKSIPKPKAAYQSVSKNDQLWKTPSSAVPPHIHLKEPKKIHIFSFTKHNIWPVITLNFSNYKKCTFSSLN